LHQVIPQVPFPNHFARGFAGRFDFDERIGHHAIGHRIGPTSRGNGFLEQVRNF
jgi:hypothetical protein